MPVLVINYPLFSNENLKHSLRTLLPPNLEDESRFNSNGNLLTIWNITQIKIDVINDGGSSGAQFQAKQVKHSDADANDQDYITSPCMFVYIIN